MITIHELLEDKIFREFFITKPILPAKRFPDHLAPPRWRVYVQREMDGPWAKKEFHTYIEGFRFLKPYLKKRVHDAAIQSKGIAYEPPFKVVRVMKGGKPKLDDKGKPVLRRIVWRPQLATFDAPHTWCTYCRRPTVFAWFSKHHAMPKGFQFDPALQRCTICGASERLVLNYA